MQLKNLIVGGVVVLSFSLFTGCAKSTIKPIKNHKIQGDSLYVNSFKNISNKSKGYGFKLNTYQPKGYDTHTYEDKEKQAILFMKNSKNNYEIIECKNNFISTFAFNILIAPAAVGINLLLGGMCDTRHTFDYESFDEDAKKWVEDNNIDRQIILENYNSLTYIENKKDNLFSSYKAKQNETLANMYKRYSKEYAKYPKVKKHTIDLSSLYKKELLTSNVTFVENKLDKKSISAHGYYGRQVASAFPCKSTTQCIFNMKESIQAINKKSLIDMKNLQTSSSEIISDYQKTLQKQSKYLKTNYKKGLQSDIFNDKTIHYKIITKDSLNAHTKKLNVTYKIIDMDYKDVYPSFKNSDKELSIHFDPKSKTITFANKTSRYLQIKSIDMYYNNRIYRINASNAKTYSSELSPEAFEKMKINQKIPNAIFNNITKKKALATKIKFGFSVKYTLGDSTKNKTLYRQDKMSLFSLIKNK